MDRDVEALGGLDEPLKDVEVELAGIRQRTHDDTVGTQRPGEPDVADRRVDLVVVVDEAAASGSHQHVHEPSRGCRVRGLDGSLHEPRRGREPAEPEHLAEFHAGGTRLERDADPCGILDGDLDGKES